MRMIFLASLISFIFPNPVFAYVGPGMGGGMIAAILGIVGAIFLALFGIIYYPVKRALKRRKKENN